MKPIDFEPQSPIVSPTVSPWKAPWSAAKLFPKDWIVMIQKILCELTHIDIHVTWIAWFSFFHAWCQHSVEIWGLLISFIPSEWRLLKTHFVSIPAQPFCLFVAFFSWLCTKFRRTRLRKLKTMDSEFISSAIRERLLNSIRPANTKMKARTWVAMFGISNARIRSNW